ncbi:spore coat protein [Bacillus sp. USDA818B3_A]|jgi:spore coat protein X|uniref:spore coat protein n=1 Tax=Bacillus sp. USDA818B3_A TaxID=2698834 RepID=UPI00136ECE00|nr:spore coat protein [Bacillus sp. USDA818B3_A]
MSENKWRALDHCDDKCKENDANVTQDADQFASTKQESFEWIIVENSECVNVHTTDTQAAVSLQAAIQVAIAIVISITIGDTEKGNAVAQDLKQFFKSKQRNTQKTVISGCKDVEVVTTDTQVTVNIQALLQVLVAVVAKIDIF